MGNVMASDVSQNQSHTGCRRRWLPVAGLTVLIAGGIWGWTSILKDRVIPKRFGVVEQGRIYRSGQLSAALVKKVLVKYNIRVIVDLTSDNPKDADQQAEKAAVAELGIKVVRLPLKGDGTGDINKYARAIAEIVEAGKKGKPVLVHCAAGAQRTGGIIAAYRLLVEKKDPSFVIDELARYGWKSKHDTQLLTWLNGNMGELAALLKQMNVINEVPDPPPQLHPE
jgi:protein tyrosine phosphatase (PTP) superfamily phosphohydrolase (DUF442 family)